jgi:hypothetical protein
MGLFRALNLLQAVEGQYTLGAELETILSSSLGREAEFGAMLGIRHMARRMAGNTVTMAAITSSDTAIKVVFEQTTQYNYRPIQEVSLDQAAMISTSTILNSLIAVVDNDVAWGYFSVSPYYEQNIVNILTTLIGLDPANYANITSLILDPSAMLDITLSNRAMKALVASSPAMAVVTQNSAAMANIAASNDAVLITANSDASMHLVAQSAIALAEVTPTARGLVLTVASAVIILGSYESAWDSIMSSSNQLSANIYGLLIVFGALDSTIFANVADIFSDTAASFAVANSKPAMMSILYEAEDATTAGITSVLDVMIASDNLGTVLGSLVAITEIASDVPTMNALIANATAFPILLTSSDAKAAIFASPTLIATMMTSGSDSLAAVQGLAASATVVNDAAIGTFKTVGVAGNIIILTGVMGSIVATTLNNTFRGDTQSDFTIGLPGTSLSSGPVDINLPFTNAVWDIASIAATAAGNVTITYVDFN